LDRVKTANAKEVRRCFWPDEYAEDTPECAWRFVQEQHTIEERTGLVRAMPGLEFLERYVHEWHECKRLGRVLIIEKCRRMVISWCARALELHQMGLGPSQQILAGEDFDAAARHVWRLQFLYTGLRERNPSWHLPDSGCLRYEGERKLKMFSLPNGSVCDYANGQASGLQGQGAKIMTLEEAAQYRYLAGMVAQAQILVLGSEKGGTLVHLITNTPRQNAPGAYDWSRIKAGWDC
jgi:hypothetical protein